MFTNQIHDAHSVINWARYMSYELKYSERNFLATLSTLTSAKEIQDYVNTKLPEVLSISDKLEKAIDQALQYIIFLKDQNLTTWTEKLENILQHATNTFNDCKLNNGKATTQFIENFITQKQMSEQALETTAISNFNTENYRFLSPYNIRSFTIEDITYLSPMQYVQYQKAILFNDVETANLILGSKIPNDWSNFGKLIRNFDPIKWSKCAFMLMKRAFVAKFNQNPELKESLLQTNNIPLVNENTWGDTYWGICNGTGQNKLGNILSEIRKEYQQ